MICPNCSADLLRKERVNNTCIKCSRKFALDPKDNSLKLHDLRMRTVTEKLTDGGRLTGTVTQLFHAAARKPLKEAKDSEGRIGCSIMSLVVGAIPLFAYTQGAGSFRFMMILGGALTFLGLVFVWSPAFRTEGVISMNPDEFRKKPLKAWVDLYGSLPPGIVEDEGFAGVPPPPDARAVLVCPDVPVAAFLAVNGVPERLRFALAADAEHAPPGLPVIVLHGATPDGCLLTSRIRAALPGRRVIDAGVPPRAVMASQSLLPLRRGRLRAGKREELRASGTLTDAELDWLHRRWCLPLEAVPPVKLLGVVERVLERVAERTALDADPERRHAEAIGFLTPPQRAAEPGL